MYVPRSMVDVQQQSCPQNTTIKKLADYACRKPLVVYAGAGVSQAPPSCMPSGTEVAKKCYEELSDRSMRTLNLVAAAKK